jgi:hypothetical protein
MILRLGAARNPRIGSRSCVVRSLVGRLRLLGFFGKEADRDLSGEHIRKLRVVDLFWEGCAGKLQRGWRGLVR